MSQQEKLCAIVTGAGSGIGRATAKKFVQEGYFVVLNGRTKDKLMSTLEDIGAENGLAVAGDVSKPDDVTALINQSVAHCGRIDVLVNNAGIAVFENIHDITLEDWDRQMAINVTGPFLMTKAAMPHLEATKGSIVNVSSVSGIGGDWSGFAYNTSKGALNLMTKGLALDIAAKGVRINAVAPSLTKTDMASGVLEQEEVVGRFFERIPLGRAAFPEEVANTIAFLASEQASFVNGAIVTVDGGLTASNGQPKL